MRFALKQRTLLSQSTHRSSVCTRGTAPSWTHPKRSISLPCAPIMCPHTSAISTACVPSHREQAGLPVSSQSQHGHHSTCICTSCTTHAACTLSHWAASTSQSRSSATTTLCQRCRARKRLRPPSHSASWPTTSSPAQCSPRSQSPILHMRHMPAQLIGPFRALGASPRSLSP